MSKVTDPNAKNSNGFIWAVGVLLVIIAIVIGYIVWNGRGAKTSALAEYEQRDVAMDMVFADNAVTLKSANAAADAAEVDLYEDFSCPHCGELAIATDGQMKDAIEAGKLVVNVRTLNFLDGKDIENNSGHSTKAAAVMEQVAESGDAKVYWNLRSYLLEHQQDVAHQWSFEDFGTAAKELGADADTVKNIKDVDIKNGNKLAKANYDLLEKTTGKVSSPRIIEDGKDVPADDSQSIEDWVSIVTS